MGPDTMPVMHTTITTAVHTAYLDVMAGAGVLVCPCPWDDVHVRTEDPRVGPHLESMHDVDLRAMLQRLEGYGWSLVGDGIGWSPDDRQVRLLGAEELDLDRLAESLVLLGVEVAATSGIELDSIDWS